MFTNETQKNCGQPAMPSKLKEALMIIAVMVLGMPMQNAQAVRTLSPVPIIFSVEVDQIHQHLIVSGKNFGSIQPEVWLAGRELKVTENSPTFIVADLPPLLHAANYRLMISGKQGPGYTETFDV